MWLNLLWAVANVGMAGAYFVSGERASAWASVALAVLCAAAVAL